MLTELAQQMALLAQEPLQKQSAYLRKVAGYFFYFEPRLIERDFVLRFSTYINNLYTRMVDEEVAPAIHQSVLLILGKMNTQCAKICAGISDDDYFMNFKIIGRLLGQISDCLE